MRTCSPFGLKLGLIVVCGACSVIRSDAAAQPSAAPVVTTTVGIEGRILYRWDGPTLRVRAMGPKSVVLLRLADMQQDGAATLYDLRVIGLKPGTFDVREWLERVDGVALGTDMPSAAVEVRSTLPADDSGELRSALGFSVPSLGGYRTALIVFGVLWILPVGAVVVRAMARRRKAPTVVAAPAPVTLADQLRPLVNRALDEGSTSADRAALERLLIAFWRERLGLMNAPASESLAMIRRDSTAATLLDAVERWLHAPRSDNKPDVERLLEPYRSHAPLGSGVEPNHIDVKPVPASEGATP